MSEQPSHSYLRDHEIRGESLRLNLKDESASILDAARTAGTGHTAKTLVKDGPLRLVVLGLRSGSTLRQHQAGGPVSIHVLDGRVSVLTEGRSESLDAGSALVLESSVPHSLEAQMDSIVLLTIAWPDFQ